ncbi:MAG: SGNH/GDSL hydrolase family protein [Candidatus Pacearchaeota archaeon]|jgi:lysophospholipase L1-like esterase
MGLLKYLDKDLNDFESRANNVVIVCAGDSITGYNNSREKEIQRITVLTYPQFLADELKENNIADCGIAGQFSRYALSDVRLYLDNFKNSTHFVIGYGTNDLATKVPSEIILGNMKTIIQNLLEREKTPLVLNVPYANKSNFSTNGLDRIKKQRDYHNQGLANLCKERNVQMIDICSLLGDSHFTDAIHPDIIGAKLIAKEVAKYLK